MSKQPHRTGRMVVPPSTPTTESHVIVAAATHDPGIILQAQKLDLVAQWLGGLSVFLSALQHREIGREPLDFDGVAATLGLKNLGERLAGCVAETVVEDFELF